MLHKKSLISSPTYKKPIPKRRFKRILNLVIFLVLIFILTTGILFFSSFVLFKQNRIVLNPMGSVKNNPIIHANVTSNQSENMQKIFDIYHLTVSDVSVGTDSAMHVEINDAREIIFSKNKELNNQLASLQLIMNRLTIEGKHFTRIDFRFDDPVITF